MKEVSAQKSNGQFYTPAALAGVVAALGIHSADCKILDPCFGEGALLSAANGRLRELGSKHPEGQLFGYDVEASHGRTALAGFGIFLPEDRIREIDFFSVSGSNTEAFDVVLMNPPFVRHHLLTKDDQSRIRASVGMDRDIPHTADLWVYFILHSLKFLCHGGTLAAILPWSLLHADYARPVRTRLSEQFREIHVFVTGQRVFDGTQERVLILVGVGFGSHAHHISVHYCDGIPRLPAQMVPIQPHDWIHSPWHSFAPPGTLRMLLRLADRLGFRPLREYAKVRIGAVTGANSFFTLDARKACDLGLPSEYLRPVVRHASQLNMLRSCKQNGRGDVILAIPRTAELSGSLMDYIQSGEKLMLHRRYHTSRREPWYSIPDERPPDAFFPYMTKEVPFLVLNTGGLWNTNTVHRVDFLSSVSNEERKWIQLSTLTSISQLSIELAARTYGGGVLKIEPSAAANMLVWSQCDQEVPRQLVTEVDRLLLSGNRLNAAECVDGWFCQKFGIQKREMGVVREHYHILRHLRLGQIPKSVALTARTMP